MYKSIAFLLILFIFLLVCTPLFSQTWETHTCKNDVQDLCCVGDYCWVATTGGVVKVNINDFSFEEYDQDDWPAGNSASAIIANNNQILLGLLGRGITFYDGINSINYQTNTSDLIDNHVISIAIDTLNRIWMGTWQGISMYAGNEWQNFTTENSLLGDNHINAIAVDKNNKVWCGTNKGLYSYDGLNWQSFTKANSQLKTNLVNDIKIEYDNKIWLATNGVGVHFYENDQWVNYNKDNSGLLENYIKSAFIDSKNNKWFGSCYGRVYCYNDTTWTIFDSTNCILPFDSTYVSSPSAYINVITEDKNGNFWIGGTSGLFFYNVSDWKKVIISGELQTSWITAIAVDRQNNKWYGTNNGGVSVDRNGTWQTYNTSNSTLQDNMIDDIAVDSCGNVWISTNHKGISIFNGDSLLSMNASGGWLPINSVKSIAVDKEGNVWLGSWHKGVYKYDGNTFTSYSDPASNLNSTAVADIGFDLFNNKWICTSDMDGLSEKAFGVARFNDAAWQFFTVNNGIYSSNSADVIAIENNGDIWFATTGGVYKYDGMNWVNYNTDNSGLLFNWVSSMTIDNKGRKWFGSEFYGLCMFDDEIWYTFSAANSKFIGGMIYALATDKLGNVIIGTNIGVSIYKDIQTKITNKTKINIPYKTTLFQNYPNPFNSETRIQYGLTQKGHVKIQVYNIYGQIITCLYDGMQSSGSHTVLWQGENNNGETVASGIYFCRLTLDGRLSETRRLVFLK